MGKCCEQDRKPHRWIAPFLFFVLFFCKKKRRGGGGRKTKKAKEGRTHTMLFQRSAHVNKSHVRLCVDVRMPTALTELVESFLCHGRMSTKYIYYWIAHILFPYIFQIYLFIHFLSFNCKKRGGGRRRRKEKEAECKFTQLWGKREG